VSSFSSIATVTLVVLAISSTIVVSVVALLRMIQQSLMKQVASRYPADEILMHEQMANFFGLESKGVWQCRGNGALVLTRDTLHFFMFQPRSEFMIPLHSIRGGQLVRSHLGKTVFRQLLKVHFELNGKPDSAAWYVHDPQAWLDKLESLQTTTQGQQHHA